MLSIKTLKNKFSLFKFPISLSEWHKPRPRIWAKIISLLVTVTFVFPYLTWAFEAKNYPKSGPQVLFDQKPFKINGEFGTIMQSFSGQDRLVVCVQDLHCNYEVQNNIARLIDDLAKQYGLDLVGVEGESLPINVASLSTFPLEKVKQETAHYLMKQGKITGPEMYAAIGRHAVRLQGIETQALYDNNREHVMSFLNHESQGYIYDLRETLNALKDSVYNQALAKIDEKKQAWREGDLSFLKYSVYIYEYGRQRKLNLKSYPNLSRYVSRQQNIFPKAVDSDELFKELEALDSNLRAGLYTSADQQVMDSLLHRLDIMEKLVNISAAPRDLSEFRENPEGFQVERFLEYIRQHDEAGEMRLDVEVYELNRYLQEVQAFYRIADRRSAAFVENMLSLMDKQQTKIAILVTGGYHTEEVLKELKHRKESYVSVKPCLRHQDVINPYFALLKNRRTPLEKLLAQNQNILSLPSNFMGPEAATFGKMMQYLFYEATMEEGISRGNTKISEIGAFVEKWMAAYVKRHNGIKANWADARMNETAGVYIVPFAGDYSMVVRPKGRLKLSPAAHERMINNLEFAMMNNRALAAMEAQLLKTGGRVVQGTKVQIALHGALVQAVPMGGRMVILAAPSLMSRVQSFSLSGALGGWQQDFYQLLPQGPAGLLKQGQELFGTGWERAVKTLKPLRFYLLGGALVSAGLGLVFLGVLPATAMSLLFIAGAVIPIIVLNKPFGLHLRPEIAILPALLLLATGPPAGDVEEGNQVSGSLLKRIVKAEAKGALPEPGAVLAANPRTPFVAEGIFKAAKEMNTFVLFEIALSQMVVNDHKGYSGMTARQFADMIYKAAAKEGFPKDRYALHADHMTVKENTWEAIQLAKDMIRDTVNAGYTSFTLDASYLFNSQPGLTVYKQLEDNIQVTAELAHYLKQLMGEREFAVEVEVGEIGGIDPKTGEKMLTTVEEAVAFIGALHEKGVYPDLLAINNGAVHGYTFDESGQKIAQTTIDLERTKEIAEALKKGFPDHPVKLHQSGGSGTPEETLAQFPASGILKVSVGADYMSAALDHLSVELYEKMKVWTLEHKSDEARRKGIASQDEIIGKYIKFAIAEFQESIAKISRKKRKNIAHAAYEVTLKYIAALNARDMAGNIEKSELDLSTGKSLLEHFSRKPESVSELIKTRSKANLNNPPRYGDPELWDTILEGFNPRHKIEFNRKFIHKKLGDSFGQMLTPAEYESLIREMQTKADILIFQLGEHGDHLYYFYDIKSNIVMRYKKNPEYDNPLFDDMFPYRDSFIRMRRLIKDKCYVINNKAARDFIFAKAEIQEAVKEERLNEIKSHLQAADQNYLRKMRWFQKNIILDMNSKMREEFWELLPEARGNYLELPSDEVPLYWQLPAWARKIYFYLPGDEQTEFLKMASRDRANAWEMEKHELALFAQLEPDLKRKYLAFSRETRQDIRQWKIQDILEFLEINDEHEKTLFLDAHRPDKDIPDPPTKPEPEIRTAENIVKALKTKTETYAGLQGSVEQMNGWIFNKICQQPFSLEKDRLEKNEERLKELPNIETIRDYGNDSELFEQIRKKADAWFAGSGKYYYLYEAECNILVRLYAEKPEDVFNISVKFIDMISPSGGEEVVEKMQEDGDIQCISMTRSLQDKWKAEGVFGKKRTAKLALLMAGVAVFAAVIGRLFGVETGLEPEVMAGFVLTVVSPQRVPLRPLAWIALRTDLKSYLNKSITRMATLFLPFLVLMLATSGDMKKGFLELEEITIDDDETALKIIEIIVNEMVETGQLESNYEKVFPDGEKKEEIYKEIYKLAQKDEGQRDISVITKLAHIKNLIVVGEKRQNIQAFFDEVVNAMAQSIKTRNKFISHKGVSGNDYENIRNSVKDITDGEKEAGKISKKTAGELEENEKLFNALLKAGVWDLFEKLKKAVREEGHSEIKKEIANSLKWGALSVLNLEEFDALPNRWEWIYIRGVSAAAEQQEGEAAGAATVIASGKEPVNEASDNEKSLLTQDDREIVKTALINIFDQLMLVVRGKEIGFLSHYLPESEYNYFASLVIINQDDVESMLSDNRFQKFYKKYNPKMEKGQKTFIIGKFEDVVIEALNLKRDGVKRKNGFRKPLDLSGPKTEEMADPFRLTENDIDDFIKQARLQRSIIDVNKMNKVNAEALEVFLSPESIGKYFELGLNREVSGNEAKVALQNKIISTFRAERGTFWEIRPPTQNGITIALISVSRHMLRIKRIKASVAEIADSITEPAPEAEVITLPYRDLESAIMEIAGQDNQYKAICVTMNDKGIAHFIELIRNNPGNIKKIFKSNLIFGLIVSYGKAKIYQPYAEWLGKSRTVKEFLEAVLVKAREKYQQRVEQEQDELIGLQQKNQTGNPLNSDELLRLLKLQKAYPSMLQVEVAALIGSASKADLQAAEDKGFAQGVKAVKSWLQKLPIAVQQGNRLKELEYEKKALLLNAIARYNGDEEKAVQYLLEQDKLTQKEAAAFLRLIQNEKKLVLDALAEHAGDEELAARNLKSESRLAQTEVGVYFEIIRSEGDPQVSRPAFSLKNIFIMGLGFLTLVYTYLHLWADMSVSLLSSHIGSPVVLLLSVILPQRILLPKFRLFELSSEPMAPNFSVVMRIFWETGWYDSNQDEARQRLIYLLKSFNNQEPDEKAVKMIEYWKARQEKSAGSYKENLDLIIAYWEGKLNVPDLIAYWEKELNARFKIGSVPYEKGIDVEKVYDRIIAILVNRISGATDQDKQLLFAAISDNSEHWDGINEGIIRALQAAGYKLPGEIEIETEPNIPQIDLKNTEDVDALIGILGGFLPGLNTALTPEGNIQATPPDGRYPYEYPRDKAQILMNLMEIIPLIETLESDETRREEAKKRILSIVGKCLEYTLSLQNENGGWDQRYNTQGEAASYKANQLDGNGLILRSLFEYLQRLDKTPRIGFITAHRKQIQKAVEFMLEFYDEEKGMFYSVNGVHEWAPGERGYDIWTNSLCIAGLRAAAYMFEVRGKKEPAAKWKILADKTERTMLRELWDEKNNSFVRVTDRHRTIKDPDVALMAPYLFGLLGPDDPKMRGTARNILKGLSNKFWGGLDRYPLEQAIYGTRDNMGWGPWLNYTAQQAQYLFDLLESGSSPRPEEIKGKIVEFMAVFKAYSKGGQVPEHITIPEFLENWVGRASGVGRLKPHMDRYKAVLQAREVMAKYNDAYATITPVLIWGWAEVSEAIAKLFGSNMVKLEESQKEKLLHDLYAGIDEVEAKLGTGTKTGPILVIPKQLKLIPKRVMPILMRTANVAIALLGIGYLIPTASATTGILPFAASDGILALSLTAIYYSMIVIGIVAAGYKLVSWIMQQRQTAGDISVPDQPRPAAALAAAAPVMDTEGLIEGTVGPNEAYQIEIWGGFEFLRGVHGDMLKFGAWAIKLLTSARAIDVDIISVNSNPKIRTLLTRALKKENTKFSYAEGISLEVSKKSQGSYTVSDDFESIKTIGVSASVLAILDQDIGEGWFAEARYKLAEALFIHAVKHQVWKYNAMVRSRKGAQDLLVEMAATETKARNKSTLAILEEKSWNKVNVLAKKDGKVTLTAAMLLEALLAMLPDGENVQTQAKSAINQVLQKGGELTLEGLLQASLSEKTAKVPMLAAIKGLLQATERGPEDATLTAAIIDLLKVKGRVNTAGPVDTDPNIKTVELMGEMPLDTADIMLDMILEARQGDKVDQRLLTALANAVKALKSKAAGGIITELSVEDGRLLASYIQQARMSALTDSNLGCTSEGLFVHADTIGYEAQEINNVEVSVPVLVGATTKEKVVNLAQIVTQDEIPDGMQLKVFTHGKRVPGQLEASSPMQKRIAWTMQGLARILPQGAQSYMSRIAVNLSPERGLLDLIQNLEKSGLMTASTAQDLVNIHTDADALAFLNRNEPLSIVWRSMATAANGKAFSAALAEAADCMAKRIAPDTLGEVTTKVERNTAEDMLNVLFFSGFFSQMGGGKLMAIAEVDASNKMWENQLFAGLKLQARKIMVPKAMLTVSGHKATFGSLVDTLEALPVTVDYEQLRLFLKRCLRTLDGSA